MKISSTLFHSIAQILVIVLAVSLPILYLPLPWVALAQSKMLIVGVIGVLIALFWTIAVSMEGKLTVPKSGVLAAAVLLPIAYIGSSIFSRAPHALVGSGVESDTAAAMVLWFALLASSAVLLSSGKLLGRVYRAILVAALAVEAIQLFGFFFSSQISLWSINIPAASVIGSWHDLGIFLVLAVVFAASTLETSFMKGRWAYLSWAVLILAFPLLVIINISDVWIALAAVSLLATVYAWFIGWNRNKVEGDSTSVPQRFTFGIFITIFLLALSFVFVGSTIKALLPSTLQGSQTEVRPSWQATAEVANSVYRGGGLIFGSGPNTFDRQWGLYKPESVNETAYWNADFVQGFGFIPTAFITVGLLGALAWAVFLLMVLVTIVRIAFSAVIENSMWRMPVFALSVAVLYLWITLVIYTPGQALLALTFILTGMLVASARIFQIIPTLSWEFARSKYGFAFIVLPVIVVIGIGASSVGITSALAADMLVNRGITIYNTSGDASSAQENINRALIVLPNYDRALRASVELSLLRFNELSGAAAEDDGAVRAQLQAVLQQAISGGLSAVSSDSDNYQNWLTLAGVYQRLAGVQVEGAYDNAKEAYEKALAANPSSPVPYLQLAQLASLQQDNNDTVRAYLKEALDKKKNYADAHYLLSQLYVSEGDWVAAQESALAAVNASPSESVLWYQLGIILYQQNSYSDAVSALGQAVALNANYANALYILGYALNDSDRKTEAIFVFERVLALNPDNAAISSLVEALKDGREIPSFNR